MQAIFYYAVFYPVIELLAALATALILIYGGAQVLAGGLTLGALVAFIQYSERFWRPISDLSEKFNVLQAAMAASERIFGLLDTKPAGGEPGGRRCGPPQVEGRVALRGRVVRVRRRARPSCPRSTSRWSRARASRSWARPAPARPRSSAC